MSVTDPETNETQYAYDALNRVDQVTDPLSKVTTISYGTDTRNLVSLVVDPLGYHTSYTRNGFGEATQVSSPDAGPTDYAMTSMAG